MILVSIISGIGPTLVILGKHMDKYVDDSEKGISSLPVVIGLTASLLVLICRRLWILGGPWRVAAAALGTTLAVDVLFLAAALLAPHLSGLI